MLVILSMETAREGAGYLLKQVSGGVGSKQRLDQFN